MNTLRGGVWPSVQGWGFVIWLKLHFLKVYAVWPVISEQEPLSKVSRAGILWPKGEWEHLDGCPVRGWLFVVNLELHPQGCPFTITAGFYFVLYYRTVWVRRNLRDLVNIPETWLIVLWWVGMQQEMVFYPWLLCGLRLLSVHEVCVNMCMYLYISIYPIFMYLVPLKDTLWGKLCTSSHCIYFPMFPLCSPLSHSAFPRPVPRVCRAGALEGETGQVFHQQHLSLCPRGAA